MTDTQRKARITQLVLAGADVCRSPRRPIDAELHALLEARPGGARGGAARLPGAGRRARRQSGPEYAALYR